MSCLGPALYFNSFPLKAGIVWVHEYYCVCNTDWHTWKHPFCIKEDGICQHHVFNSHSWNFIVIQLPTISLNSQRENIQAVRQQQQRGQKYRVSKTWWLKRWQTTRWHQFSRGRITTFLSKYNVEEVRGHSTLTLHIFSFRTPALYIGSLVNGDLASWVIYSCKNVISMQRNSLSATIWTFLFVTLIPNLYNSLFYAYVKPYKQVDAVLIVAEEPIFAFNHSHSGPLPHILLREGMGVEILTAQIVTGTDANVTGKLWHESGTL